MDSRRGALPRGAARRRRGRRDRRRARRRRRRHDHCGLHRDGRRGSDAPPRRRRGREDRPGDLRADRTRRRTGQLDVRGLGRPLLRPPERHLARLRLRDRQAGPHRHELPRDRGRAGGRGQLLGRRSRPGAGRGKRSFHRPRRPQDRRAVTSPDSPPPRELGRRARRGRGRRHREPVRPRADGDRRNRQRPPARDHLPERLHDRQGDPDGRAHQPRQLGRPPPERGGRGDRRQLADRGLGRRRQRGHRLRRSHQHRQGGRLPDPRKR